MVWKTTDGRYLAHRRSRDIGIMTSTHIYDSTGTCLSLGHWSMSMTTNKRQMTRSSGVPTDNEHILYLCVVIGYLDQLHHECTISMYHA